MGEPYVGPPDSPVEPVTDVYHGRVIVDPYRWLEDDTSAETQAWVDAQNAYTRSILDRGPERARIRSRLAELLAIGSVTPPVEREGHGFFTRRSGDNNQPKLYLYDFSDHTERVLVDPNQESDRGVVALDWWHPSPDGRLVAYGLSSNGDEESTLAILDVDSGQSLADSIERTRFCSLAWLPDSRGFYYTRYPLPGSVPEGEEHYHRKVFFHLLGDDPAADALVFGDGLPLTASPSVSLSRDGRWLLVTVNYGWSRSEVFLLDRSREAAGFVPVVTGKEALFHGRVLLGQIYLLTNFEAPRWRVISLDAEDPDLGRCLEVIPEQPDISIEDFEFTAGNRLVVQLLSQATSRLRVYSMSGEPAGEIPLPELGTVSGLHGDSESDRVYFGFESFTLPPSVYCYTLGDAAPKPWATVDAAIDVSAYETRQVTYHSKDGTPVTMFIVARKDVPRDGAQPVLLTGYGGFNIARTPVFNRPALFWLEQGGIFALANLRGGSENGEAWHQAGMLDRKQNVFDDFIGAAEYLIAERYTSPQHLAIQGGSNGGLLVGAALTQRPDLYKAVVCAVPLLDMLRFERFLIAQLWVAEYGSAQNQQQFDYLYAYSPYHHVEPGVAYPATLLMTATSDSRVAPLHARKMAARLQAATSGDAPILLRVETEAGHGIGKPVSKQIEEQADVWTFICQQLGVQVRD